jgi:hypothetical protein
MLAVTINIPLVRDTTTIPICGINRRSGRNPSHAWLESFNISLFI